MSNWSEKVDKLIASIPNIMEEVFESSGDLIESMLYGQARTFLSRYYGAYTPKQYKRTHQLENIISTHRSGSVSGSTGTMEVKLLYSPYMAHYEDRRKTREIDSEWIVDMFMQGIHPRINRYMNEPYIGEPNQYEMWKFALPNIKQQAQSVYTTLTHVKIKEAIASLF